MKRLCVLGSTGSIGQNCLRVVRAMPDRFQVLSLCAGRNLEVLADQVREFSPQLVAVASPELVQPLRVLLRAKGFREPPEIRAGREGRIEAATLPEVDFVVSASHGITGLVATYAAIKAGKQIGLANKEILVVAGELVMQAAQESGVDILPIDSEHCAVHQCLRSGRPQEVRRLILTGSGGPFLNYRDQDFASITPEQALRHPVWKMGGRITIDSATLMNKGFEIIEARWLFGFPSDQIDVLIHPESLVHSMIEFNDGSIIAQMSVADMRLPIQYALTFPERTPMNGNNLGLDLTKGYHLHFQEPDIGRFPCLRLGREALNSGGSIPCVLNAADEVAVEQFLAGRITFSDIPSIIEEVTGSAAASRLSSVDEVLACDREARRRAEELISQRA